MKIHVDVTQEDLDKGIRGRWEECAVHRAIERLGIIQEPFGVYWSISLAGRNMATIKQLGRLPVAAFNLIEAWDRGAHVEPFSFDMEINYPITNLEK
jgi:hypothetical protein